MNRRLLQKTLAHLQKMAKEAGAEINISPGGISLWTSDASDYTIQRTTPQKAIKGIKAIRKFRKYWKLER